MVAAIKSLNKDFLKMVGNSDADAERMMDAGKKLFAYIKMQETPSAALLNDI